MLERPKPGVGVDTSIAPHCFRNEVCKHKVLAKDRPWALRLDVILLSSGTRPTGNGRKGAKRRHRGIPATPLLLELGLSGSTIKATLSRQLGLVCNLFAACSLRSA